MDKSQLKMITNKCYHYVWSETWKFVGEHRPLKAKGVSVEQFSTKITTVQAACRIDCNAVIGKICGDLETHSANFESKTFMTKCKLLFYDRHSGPDNTWSDNMWPDNLWPDNAWSDNTWPYNMWPVKTWLGNTGFDNTWFENTWFDSTWHDNTWPDDTLPVTTSEERDWNI